MVCAVKAVVEPGELRDEQAGHPKGQKRPRNTLPPCSQARAGTGELPHIAGEEAQEHVLEGKQGEVADARHDKADEGLVAPVDVGKGIAAQEQDVD